jgi:two-component system, cell cycle sensor histidine kinase and response regulator CckA
VVTRKTVLVVDDESAQRAWMRGILRHQGYTVLEAADYAEALSVRAGHDAKIDLLLIDLRLPGGSGYDLSEELMAAHPNCRILFVSGTTGAEICKYFARPLPAVQFLQKPFDAAQLAARVREIFGAHHGDG